MSTTIKLKDKDKEILILSAFVIIVLIDLIVILFGWQLRQMFGSYKSAKEKKQAIVSLDSDIVNLERYKKESVDLDKKISELKLSVVEEMDISALVENISNLAESNGVKITQIKPVIDNSEPKIIEAKDAKFAEIVLQIKAKSDFHQLGNFISKIESAKSFLKVASLEIETDNRNYFIQNIELDLKSFINIKE